MPDYDYGAYLRQKCIRETEAAEARYYAALSRLHSALQRQVLRDHPKQAVRRHPSGLIAPPPTLTPRWLAIVAYRASQALRWWVDGFRELGRKRVTRGRLGHSRKEQQQ